MRLLYLGKLNRIVVAKESMNSQQPESQQESLTLIVRKSTRNAIIAKLIIVAGLTALFSYYWALDVSRQYHEGQNLTQKEYLAKFEQHKAKLIETGKYSSNVPFLVLIAFIYMSFFIGSYELIALAIGLLIGKFIR